MIVILHHLIVLSSQSEHYDGRYTKRLKKNSKTISALSVMADALATLTIASMVKIIALQQKTCSQTYTGYDAF